LPALSAVPAGNVDSWIRAQRGPRAAVDPFLPYGFFPETERGRDGTMVSSAVVLLTNRECPWHCLMCDLWRHTLVTPTPSGAIPRQIQHALDRLPVLPAQLKLYNSGSFFDNGAIPRSDYPAIAALLKPIRHLIVESHPRLVGSRCLEFKPLLAGSLEVAMGLETAHPEVLSRLNKGITLDDFRRAAEFLRKNDVEIRAFVLVQPPFEAQSLAIEWAVRSAEFAFDCGAGVVSLLPTRQGNGALEKLESSGEFSPPRLSIFESAFAAALALKRGRVFADTWDLKLFSSCPRCLAARQQRLETMNITQTVLPPVQCRECSEITSGR
jgi:archaeosine synthase beta-subunit